MRGALALYAQWRDETDDADAQRLLDELIAQQRQQGVECRREFFRWWTPERRVELEAKFAELSGKKPAPK